MNIQINKQYSFLILLAGSIIIPPLFFIIYRLIAYQAMPIDAYWQYILYYLDNNPSFHPYAPFVYRPIYPLIGTLVYQIIPLITFSEPTSFSPEQLKAIESLALINAICIYLIGVVTIWILQENKLTNKSFALTSGILAASLMFYTAFFGIDPFAFLFTIILMKFENNRSIFIPSILFSVAISEKICFVFFVYFLLKYLATHKIDFVSLFTIVFTMILYVFLRKWGPYGGHEEQINISAFKDSFTNSLTYLMTIKGLYINVLPMAILLFFFFFSKKDIPGLWTFPLVLFFIGLTMNMAFNIGRLVLHALPFFIPSIYQTVERLSTRQFSHG
ncbi:MAG: hypothetical protein KDC53_04420 [Saprospiraceae bacterium]|nr:hypothetical protein [Saprospiraceae bacterium]